MAGKKRSNRGQANGGSDRDFLGALARGLKVLTAFDASHSQMSLSDVSKLVELPRATVRRALYTLGQLGYVQSDGRIFRLSPAVLQIATAYLLSNSLSTILQPVCERVGQRVEETCSAAVLDGSEVVIIARASPIRVTAMGVGVGHRLPVIGALGRCILMGLSDEQLDEFIEEMKPLRNSPGLKMDKRALRRMIETERKQGYAYSDQEIELGYRSIAVPLRNFNNKVVGALHIGALVERASAKKMIGEFLPILQKEAAELKKQII